jgi:hypothetical protein
VAAGFFQNFHPLFFLGFASSCWQKEKRRISSQVSLVFYRSNWKYHKLVKEYEVWQEISDDIQCNEWLWKVLRRGGEP